jgi:hypothetical protein
MERSKSIMLARTLVLSAALLFSHPALAQKAEIYADRNIP